MARTDAALVRVGESDPDGVTVPAAGGADPEGLANDAKFLEAVRQAVG